MTDQSTTPDLSLGSLIDNAIKNSTEHAKQVLAGQALTLGLAFQLVAYTVHQLVLAAQQAVTAAGIAKKDAVVQAALKFYDDVIAPLDLPGPDVIIDPLVRNVLPGIVGGLVESAVALFKKIGIFGAVAASPSNESVASPPEAAAPQTG